MNDTMSRATTSAQDDRATARSRRPWRVIGITVTVLVLVGGLVVTPLVVWPLVQNLDTTTEHTTATFDRVPDRLVVEGETADIEVLGTAAGKVQVDRELEWARTKPEITESWQDDDLAVTLDCSGVGPFGWVNDVCRVDYRASVPSSSDVEATATTGSIEVDGTVGDVRATTTTGSIYGADLESDGVVAQATTGSIELAFASAPRQISAEVTTGDVVITVPDDGTAYHVTGETETGDRSIGIATDPASDRAIDVSTTTGDVTIRQR